MNNKNVAIIGAGYTGLSMAKKLIDNGYKVTIFEKDEEIGGIAKSIDKCGTKIEKHYRHIFKSDEYVIKLLKELEIENKLHWPETRMGYFSNNSVFAFGTPISLLKFKPLNLWQKFKFGLSIINIKLTKNYKIIENYTAEEWIKNKFGNTVYQSIWEPLLISKFGKDKNKISMSWLWGKISLRSSSTTIKGERLGYLDGSYEVLTNNLRAYLEKKGCKILTNNKVNKIKKNKDNKWMVKVEDKEFNGFHFVISTVAYPITKRIFDEYLSEEEKQKMDLLKYTSAKTLLIVSKKSLSDFYWINIGDNSIPFGGIIEHTNMIDKANYDNKNIIYISNYMYQDDKLYNLDANELLKVYFPHLKKINHNIELEDIEEVTSYEETYAQPVIEKNYSQIKLSTNLSQDGLYVATMAQIYPEDRGMNYAIKLGHDVADIIIKRTSQENL